MARKPADGLAHIKRTWAKGKLYLYFVTGKLDEKGKPILTRLPDYRDPAFGGTYAALLGHRNRTEGQTVMDVRQLIVMYQDSPHWKALSEGTRRLYTIYLGQFQEDFGPAQPGMLDRSDIALAVDSRAETPGAANSLLKTIRSLYLWARRRGHLENDPCKDIELLPVGEHEPWPEDLLNAALACDNDRVRLAVHLLYYTAQRIGDVTDMTWGAFKNGEVHVIQQKTKKELTFPIHSKLSAELDRVGWGDADKAIITGISGDALHPVTLRENIQDWALRMGHKIVPHGLRKNAVNTLLEVGCSVPQTASISGQSMRVVEAYARRRNQAKLGRAAMAIWEGNES